MMEIDNLLDFEKEDPLLNPPAKKRKKVIGLDDLLTDFYKEEGKRVEKASKREKAKAKAKARRNYDSDEEDEYREASLSQLVATCENEMAQIGGKDDSLLWGLCAFGVQKNPPPLVTPDLKSCTLLQSFMINNLNSELEISTDNGDTLLEGLLVNGWLSKVVIARGHLEKPVAMWTFNLMLYSSKEELRTSACDFWCSILTSEKKADLQHVKIDWLPSYSELKVALVNYGFLFNLKMESVHTNSARRGPAQNIRAWIKFATTSCQVRNDRPMYLTSEAEELVEVIICLFLDRQLQGLVVLLHECVQSAISYFTDNEWESSCEKIATSLSLRVPKDVNCLRIVECISGVKTRCKLFRSVVAHQILLSCFNYQAQDEEEILKLLISINVRDKHCDFFKVYMYLVLTENWLLSNQDNQVLNEMWRLYLRNCSCLIASTDLRSFASKVRNKAAYLLQGTVNQ